MSDKNLKVTWLDSDMEIKYKPNPAYPNGIDIDLSGGADSTCETSLSYPAKRFGMFDVECSFCGFACFIMTTGWPDDPRSVKIPCKGTRA